MVSSKKLLVNGGGDQQRVARMTLLTPPANEEKTHGFALTIEPLREDGVHQLRFIAGQAEYGSREIDGVDGILFGFTETGNPIDLRQNFQREANARLQVRVGAYLEAHPDRFLCIYMNFDYVHEG
ncbi:hypothetical protein PF008_g2925 [Phytophthora fragariae]|uniref:Uncharacterized protein n=1 Tax=Phytophthora fragariae TaxID=53985 RepID=A0A6G0SFQ6_9STRA|nr:hypothetical protein PF008_g2925 [Phytophthora fragariae]